ncbi:MAG: alanine racemase [Phormidesmis sp.]
MLSWDKTPALSPMRCCRAWVEINLSALAHNVRQIKALVPKETDVMSVVKADAYGHGAIAVARTAIAAGATWLGVATVPEGIELRQAGLDAPILVMGAVSDAEEIKAIARWQLQPTIVNPKQAMVFSETLASAPHLPPVPVHLKLDTGMSRLGFQWTQAVELARFVQQLPHLETASVYSHLATADSLDQTVMRQQHGRFEQAIAALKSENLLPPRLHLANSAATLAISQTEPSLHYDMVRVGLCTYGLYPAPHLQHVASLQSVLEVKARITHVKNIEAGAGVSYSHSFIAQRPMKIAIVGIGYADGVPRSLSNKMEVITHSQRIQQIGAITMDQLMLDVSDLGSVQEGDVVTLLGQSGQHTLSADQWAQMAGTISWEILCGFKHRLPRIQSYTAPPPTKLRSHQSQDLLGNGSADLSAEIKGIK